LGLFDGEPSTAETAAPQQPALADLVRRAIEFLQVNSGGYVLVVDAALPSSAAERNEGERLIVETLALDAAVATAMKYAGERSLIIGAGKHATGGMSLNGYPLRQDHGVALLGINVSGQPTITWATGPNGPAPATRPTLPPPNTEAASPPPPAPQSGNLRTEPAAFQAPSALNTAEDVLAVGKGAGAERLHGFLENTAIFHILKDAL
jgi:alkaline phosphatase